MVDKQLVLEHEQDGDMGHAWLRTASAGSGPFQLRSWKPNESLVIEANHDYWGGAPGVERVICRHIPEPATQLLLLEKGDVDIARNLEADQLDSLQDNPEIVVREVPKGAIYYLGLNQKNEYLAKPEVREALKYLVDYDGIANTIVKGSAVVHQSFLPRGFLGAIDDQPYTLDVEKAKALLEQAGLADGFKVTMDTRNASPLPEIAQVLQANWAEAGIELEILPGDNKQTLTKYRARTHDIYIGRWGPDYQDPHTNADTFASNPDNSDGATYSGKLAWRNAWDIPEMTAKTEAAVLERDPAKARRDVRGAAAGAPEDLALRDHVPGHRGDRRARQRAGHDLGPVLRRQQVLAGPQGVAARRIDPEAPWLCRGRCASRHGWSPRSRSPSSACSWSRS